MLGIQPARRRRSNHPGSPDDGAGVDPTMIEVDTTLMTIRDARRGPHIDTHPRQRRAA
jgi:hypothetical protein